MLSQASGIGNRNVAGDLFLFKCILTSAVLMIMIGLILAKGPGVNGDF
jgi:hypothetical protein